MIMNDLKTDRKCPECGTENVWFDFGSPGDMDHPGDDPTYYCQECGWNENDPDKCEPPKEWILCPSDLWFAMEGERLDNADAVHRIERAAFKFTDSGVAIGWQPGTVLVCAYAEGFDGELPHFELHYPFNIQNYWDALDKADKIGCAAWTCANEHPEDCDCYIWEYE